jgi:glycosyltransferase involved in cell wall biosynthesis
MLPVDTRPPSIDVGKTIPAPPFRQRPKVRVGLVTEHPFPLDVRLERQAVALTEAGYEVHLLCLLRPEDNLVYEAYRGFYIHRADPQTVDIHVPFLGKTSRFLYQGVIRRVFQRIKNIDTAWHTLIHRFTRNCRLHILQVSGLRLLDTTLNISQHYGLQTVVDLPEHYPALVELSYVARHPYRARRQRHRWEKLETAGLQRASRILTATTEARQRLLGKGINPELVLTLENTVDVDQVLDTAVDMNIIKRYKSNFVLAYVGRIHDTYQGIHTILEAMAALKSYIPDMVLLAVGPIRESYRCQLVPFIQEQGLQDRVHFVGRVTEEATVSYIDASDLCVFPHLVNDQTEVTFPEAVYRCQLLKKPVVLGNTQPMQRYAEESGGSVTFPSGNASALAELVYTLYMHPDLRRDMALQGYQTVLDRYHWAHTAIDLALMYESLSRQLSASTSS